MQREAIRFCRLCEYDDEGLFDILLLSDIASFDTSKYCWDVVIDYAEHAIYQGWLSEVVIDAFMSVDWSFAFHTSNYARYHLCKLAIYLGMWDFWAQHYNQTNPAPYCQLVIQLSKLKRLYNDYRVHYNQVYPTLRRLAKREASTFLKKHMPPPIFTINCKRILNR